MSPQSLGRGIFSEHRLEFIPDHIKALKACQILHLTVEGPDKPDIVIELKWFFHPTFGEVLLLWSSPAFVDR